MKITLHLSWPLKVDQVANQVSNHSMSIQANKTYFYLLIFLVVSGSFNASYANTGPDYCLENRWDQSTEPQKLKQYSKTFQRKGEVLTVSIFGGKKVEFKNTIDLRYFAKGVDPSRAQAVVVVTGNEYGAYELVNLKSGQRLKTEGCPVWSNDGNYFVALNHDLEMQSSRNMAAIYSSQDSYVQLTDLIEDKDRSISGGEGALWKGSTVTITLVKQVVGGEPGELKKINKTCILKGHQSTCR